MKKIFFLIGLFFLAGLQQNGFAQNFKSISPRKLTIEAPAPAFKVGESLVYSVEWLGVPVGIVRLDVKEIVKIDNHDCFHVIAKTYPNRFLKRFVDLEYQVDSYIDVESHFSRRFEKFRRLNNETSRVTIDFFQEKNEVGYKTEGSSKSIIVSNRKDTDFAKLSTNKIPSGTQDLLSSLYYFRLAKIEPNQNYSMNIYYHQVNWLVNFAVGEPFLRDIRKKGGFVLFKVSPLSGLNDFILGKHNFSVFFTADPRRIPLEFKFNTGVGAIRALIKEIP